jgi:hypothetical protein
MPFWWVQRYKCWISTWYSSPQKMFSLSALKMNTVDSSETLVPIYQTALRHVPEDCHFRNVYGTL